MARTLLVPLIRPQEDIANASETALPIALGLAQQLDADIVLLSVVELPWEANPDGSQRLLHAADAFPNDERLLAVKAQAERIVVETGTWLETVASRVPEHRTQTVVRFGDPGREIITVAGMLEEPVVVMSSHARRGLDRVIVGSVTFSVVAEAGCPVVIVPVNMAAEPDLSRVIVPLDGSLLAEYALHEGLSLVGAGLETVMLVQVVESLAANPESTGQDDYTAEREEAARYLTGVAERLHEAGTPAEWTVRNGLPAHEIAAAASEANAGLVVMATHGRSGLRRVILGSAAERVLNTAQRPLLLVRPTEEELRASAPLSSTG
jgi:nucleotide-binding universal stress UspA family protein